MTSPQDAAAQALEESLRPATPEIAHLRRLERINAAKTALRALTSRATDAARFESEREDIERQSRALWAALHRLESLEQAQAPKPSPEPHRDA